VSLTDSDILRIARSVTHDASRRFHLHGRAQLDEIRSDALLGIAKALRDHNQPHVPLAAYAHLRARGEVLDGIRRRAPLSRGDHARGVTLATIPTQRRPIVSLDQLAQRCDLSTLTPDPNSERPFRQVDAALSPHDLLTALTPQQRTAVTAYFWKDQRMWEIAIDMGLTESRVSQIIKASLKTLRQQLAAA